MKWSAPIASRTGNVVFGINHYQTLGGAGFLFDGLFVGSSVPGMDINQIFGRKEGLREGRAHVDIMNHPMSRAIPKIIFQ